MEFIDTVNELLNKADHALRTADHMVYITYPLIKENRLIKKILEDLYESASATVQAILSYESTYKRIKLQDSKTNWAIFQEQCAPRFNIAQSELQVLSELFSLTEKYKASSMDFIRKDKLIIMSDSLRTDSVGLEQLKKYLNIIKVLLLKARTKIAQEKFGISDRYL
ncbi:MAG: hypothetical protein ACPLXC_03380 [Candidatus Pacearchaeota archaeon]